MKQAGPSEPPSEAAFTAELAPAGLDSTVRAALYRHLVEIHRWNTTTSLVGPGFFGEAADRHYLESLLVLPLLPAGPRVLVDLGSGAGFPGLVLAAARQDLAVTLVEARHRKASFLRAAAHASGLVGVQVLNVRVAEPLPQHFPGAVDVMTSRAVRWDREMLALLAERLVPGGLFCAWSATDTPWPAQLRQVEVIEIPSSARRQIAIAERVAR